MIERNGGMPGDLRRRLMYGWVSVVGVAGHAIAALAGRVAPGPPGHDCSDLRPHRPVLPAPYPMPFTRQETVAQRRCAAGE